MGDLRNEWKSWTGDIDKMLMVDGKWPVWPSPSLVFAEGFQGGLDTILSNRKEEPAA